MLVMLFSKCEIILDFLSINDKNELFRIEMVVIRIRRNDKKLLWIKRKLLKVSKPDKLKNIFFVVEIPNEFHLILKIVPLVLRSSRNGYQTFSQITRAYSAARGSSWIQYQT